MEQYRFGNWLVAEITYPIPKVGIYIVKVADEIHKVIL